MKRIFVLLLVLLGSWSFGFANDSCVIAFSTGHFEQSGNVRVIIDFDDSVFSMSGIYGWNKYNSGTALIGGGAQLPSFAGVDVSIGTELGTFVYGDKRDNHYMGKVISDQTDNLSLRDSDNMFCASLWVGFSIEKNNSVMRTEVRQYYIHYGSFQDIGVTNFVISWDVLFSAGRRF